MVSTLVRLVGKATGIADERVCLDFDNFDSKPLPLSSRHINKSFEEDNPFFADETMDFAACLQAGREALHEGPLETLSSCDLSPSSSQTCLNLGAISRAILLLEAAVRRDMSSAKAWELLGQAYVL